MGEARRRKLLDPTWGQLKIHTLEINGHKVRIEEKVFKGFLTLLDDENCTLEINSTNDEINFLEFVLEDALSPLIEQFNFQRIKYKLIFDLSNLISKKVGLLHIYPFLWEELPKDRLYKVAAIELKRLEEEQPPPTERTMPIEHVRKAHKRRVAYGKGRSLRKWVEIGETVVNARPIKSSN